jgi:long-chain alkane monooxygenase
MFKLAWFVDGFTPSPDQVWRGPWAGQLRTEWSGPSFWIDIATSLERGGFDLYFQEDTAMIEDSFGGSMETTLKYALMAPKNDPLPLAPVLARATRHIGIVPTISTLQYHPYLAARLGVTLDHLTEGRIGLNIVTSVSHAVAQNFGLPQMPEHDERYLMAEEWMEACSQLWNSWDPDALVMDDQTPVYADHTKVHHVDFQGKYYATRGPLNTYPGPQRRPVIAQAGASEKGRDLAARHADVMLGLVPTPEAAIEFRKDMDRRLIGFGRDPDDLHVFYIAHAFMGETPEEGQAMWDRHHHQAGSDEHMIRALWGMSYASGGEFDYSQADLDAPVSQAVGNGETTSHKARLDAMQGKTLREALSTGYERGLNFIGSPQTIAPQMNEVIEATGRPDGYLMEAIDHIISRRAVIEITDGLCPELMKRGYIRTGYAHQNFRDNLNDWA